MNIQNLFFRVIALCFLSAIACSVLAAVSVGYSFNSKYMSVGNCSHGDRVTNLYISRFITEVTKNQTMAKLQFGWADELAWEIDMLNSAFSGNPWDCVDDVDFMTFAGHGFYAGYHGVPDNSLHYFTLNSSTNFHDNSDAGHATDEANADSWEIDWGYATDEVKPLTKWVTTYSCNFLNSTGPYWSGIMDGVHLVMGFASVMYIVADEGKLYGQKLYGGTEIMTAFFDAARQYQPYNSTPTSVRVLGATISQHDKLNSYSRKPEPIGGNDAYLYWTLIVQPR